MSTAATFRLNVEPESAKKALAIVYRAVVAERGMNVDFDDATKQNITKVATWLCSGKKPGLILSGHVGNGKTTMLKSICRLVSSLRIPTDGFGHYHNVRYLSAIELSRIAQSGSVNGMEYIDKEKARPLLAIDDVGTEPAIVKTYGNEISPLTEVIYHRYDNRLWTVVSTNLTMDDIAGRYGIRIADRCREMFNVLAYNSKSYRG